MTIMNEKKSKKIKITKKWKNKKREINLLMIMKKNLNLLKTSWKSMVWIMLIHRL